MKVVLPEREKAIRIAATSPEADAWVSANAGSGKTSLLRNRVIRLLLTGTAPNRILCLTFTKAAAAEMQSRIFEELALWVTLDDAALTARIAGLLAVDGIGASVPEPMLLAARTLFARAIETPGGLKIQTIHAFAERVLHLFPLEAGVPLDFAVLAEPDGQQMRAEARQATIEAAIRAPASPLGRAFTEILSATGTDGFSRALDSALALLSTLRLRGAAPPPPEKREAAYRAALGIKPGETAERIETDFSFASWSAEALSDAAATIRGQKKPSEAQLRLAADFEAVAQARAADAPWIEPYFRLFLTTKNEKRAKSVFVKAILDARPDLREAEEDAQEACLAYLERQRALAAFNRSLALLIFAESVLDRFIAAKRDENALDFDDLIAALRRLLLSGQSSWIMLKLDAQIEHVLVDEAQDTTREMWDIVRGLTEEFVAGEGRARRHRSIFVVGDEKQSIFSFQGADPTVFEQSRQYFADKSQRPALVRSPVALNYSFRSSDDVLRAVDTVFAAPERAEGLTAAGQEIVHHAAKQDFPGLIELWPLERPSPPEEEGRSPPRDQAVRLAARIADEIAGWLKRKTRHLSNGEPIRPGDIVILVRQRGTFFSAMLRALKMRDVPVSGADRLKLQEELVIRDLLVIAEAALLPADDLALATALRTPVFGLSDAELEALARPHPTLHRQGALIDALLASDTEYMRRAAARFALLREQAASASPFAFFSGLLIEPCVNHPAMSGRKAFLTRLGVDAADPIDAFLSEALGFSRQEPGAVRLFVEAQRLRESEIKRDLEQGSDRVRVMTVHGAKGLEGRIVFLGDTVGTPAAAKDAPAILMSGPRDEPLLVWTGTKSEEPVPMRKIRVAERRKLLAEYRRLLYVGMTRAAERLYVAGFAAAPGKKEIETGTEKLPDDPLEWSWYHLMREGFGALGAGETQIDPAGEPDPITGAPRTIRRWRGKEAVAKPREVQVEPPAGRITLPDWLMHPAPVSSRPVPPIRPSKGQFPAFVEGREANEGAPFARRRGILLHHLFQYLPDVAPAARTQTGALLLARFAPDLGEDQRSALVSDAITLLESEVGSLVFGAASRAEVAISGTIPLPDGAMRPVSGRIDRLIIEDDRIRIVDLKTGRPAPLAERPAILRQMALYRAVLSAIYPARSIEAAVLWTETGALAPLPEALLESALSAITSE